MKAAKAGREFVSILGKRSTGIGSNCSHCRGKKEGIPASAVATPLLSAGGQNVAKIGLCRLRYAKTRHKGQRARFLETFRPSR
jgi:hypothetical protein